MSFDAVLMDFEKLQQPESARVFVEAYHQSVYMRFDFGTVGQIRTPAPEDRRLKEFYEGSPVNFRVKIVDESGEHGKILAEADAIRPVRDDDENNRDPLIPVRTVGGMGQEIWRVTWEASRPVLELNQEMAGIKDRLIKETRFRSLILPEVFRTVLTQILSSSLDESDDFSEISERWFKFAAILSSEEPPLRDDRSVPKIQEWVQSVIKPFSAKHQFFDHWKEAINPSMEEAS